MTSAVEHAAEPKNNKDSISIFPIKLFIICKNSKKDNPENVWSSQQD